MHAPLRYRVLAGILIFFSFLVVATKITDPDFYWHLRDGETILATHAVPRVDTYSFTMANMPWVDHEWLVEAGIAWIWNLGLAELLAVIFAAIAFIPFAVWLSRYRSWPSLWAIAAGAVLFMSFTAVRPQVLSYFFFFIVFELLSRYYDKTNDPAGRKKIYLAVLPLVFFVWANIHAEFFSGLVLFALFLFVDTAIAWWHKRKTSGSGILFACTMLAASVITTFLNPYGAGLYGEIFRVMFSGDTMRYIQEWQSPFSTQATFSPQTIAIAIMFSIFLIIAGAYYKRLTPTRLAAAALFFLLFAKALRMGPLFVITAIPLADEGLAYAITAFSSRRHLASRRVRMVFTSLGAAASVGMLCLVLIAPSALAATQYPVNAVDFLNQSAAQGNKIIPLNGYAWGGYLIWDAPEIKVFIDGRMPHWIAPDGTSAMKDYINVFLAPQNFAAQETILKKWRVNTILMQSTDVTGGNAGLVKNLMSAGWKITYSDPVATVLQCASDTMQECRYITGAWSATATSNPKK